MLNLFSIDTTFLDDWLSHGVSSFDWPAVIDCEHDFGKLLKSPEQSVFAAWHCIQGMSPRVAQRVLEWSYQSWPQMSSQARSDHALCWQFLQWIDQVIPVTKSKTTQASTYLGAKERGTLDTTRCMAFYFCIDIITTCLNRSNIIDKQESLSAIEIDRERHFSHLWQGHVNSVYLNELHELLLANQCLIDQQGLTTGATIGLIRSATVSSYADLKCLGLLVAGRYFQSKLNNDRACHSWQLAADNANKLGWGLLEFAALTIMKSERGEQLMEEKMQLDMLRLDALSRPLPLRHSRQYRVTMVKQCVRSNWREKLTANFLAEQVEVSARTLENDFRESEGISVHEFVILEKMRRAQQLVVQGELNLRELSHACGFQSKSGFIEAYVKVHGVSPAKERSRHQQSIKKLSDV